MRAVAENQEKVKEAASEEEIKEETGQETTEAEETEKEEAETEEAGKEEAKPETEEPSAEEKKEGEKGNKKSFRKKDRKTDALNERIAELEDKVKRQLAEFENFRNRTEKEKSAMFETGAKSVIEKILPVVDNFERGLAALPEEEKGGAFAEGMQMIYKQLMTELENMGVKPIEAVGCEFDPNLHNAMMQVESEEYESGFIVQELMKGYTYRDSVVRHSMVSVAT